MNIDRSGAGWRRHLIPVALLFLALAVGCGAPPAPASDRLSGTIVLWHSLSDARAAALTTVVDRFTALHPDARVILRQLPSEAALLTEFQTTVQSGLGADLILTGSNAVNTLAASGAIRPLDSYVNNELAEQYLASALTTLRYDGRLYGLPFDLNTQVLYYDTDQVSAPATTLEQLAADARNGRVVLLNSRFRDALWGFRAFGAAPVDPQSGALTFNQGGFINWLTWLQQVRETPGFVLDPDQASLRQAFLDGRGAYYVGRASDLPTIYATLGERMGVAALPTGPSGSAGPMLSTTGFMVNAMSSEAQTDLAVELARFVTNAEQQSVLMRETLLVPANITTRISPGLFPAVAAIGAQARTAIALPNDAAAVSALATIATAFDGVLEGLTRPADAALALNNQLAGLVAGATQVQATANCPPPGTLTLMAYEVGVTARVLQTLVQGYRLYCPDITVNVNLLPPTSAVRLSGATERFRFDGDILFDLYGDVRFLIQDGQAADLTDTIAAEAVQSLRAQTLEGLRSDGRLYGLPITIDLPALYYNRDRVADPAVTLDDLRSQALAGIPITLDSTFDRAFWGIGAFGGVLTDEQGRFALDPAAVNDWLTWLMDSRFQSNIRLEPNIEVLQNDFAAGRSAYYLGSLAEATDLRVRLGGNRLGVTVLPEGPRGAGRPLMRVGSMIANSAIDAEQQALATHFLNYAISMDAQQRLLETGLVAPTNASVNLTGRTTASVFLNQAQNAQIVNSQVLPPAVANSLRSLFNQVLNQRAPLGESIDQFYANLASYQTQFPTFTLAPTLVETLAARSAAQVTATLAAETPFTVTEVEMAGVETAAAELMATELTATAPITASTAVTVGAP